MSTLSFFFSVSGVQKTHQFSMRQNVKKDVNYVLYQGTVEEEDLPCGYVGSAEIDPKATLDIIQRADEVEENSTRVFNSETKWKGNSITVASTNFLLTDVFGDFISEESVPLYWKHVLPSASIDPDSVKILDDTLAEVQEDSYRVIRHNAYDEVSGLPVSGSYASCAVYSNYENSHNTETGESEIYFVRYEVNGASHYELLNQQEVFTEATWEDIWTVTSSLKPWEKVYIISPGVTEFTLTLPQTDTDYALKLVGEGRIFSKEFLDVSDEEPWFPRISNGAFVRTVSGERYSYSVPEFSSQTFNPISPYKSIVGEKALRIRGDIYKVDATPLQVDSSTYILDVIVKNKLGQVLYAFTTDTSKDGSYYYLNGERVYREVENNNAWVTWDISGIISWDQHSGFIHLLQDYPNTYVCEISYYYKELYLQYTSLNVNPIFDETYDGQFYALYVVPTGGANVSGQTASIHYVKVNRSGRIIATSQDGSSNNYDLNSVIETDSQNIYYSLYAEGTTPQLYSSGSSTIVVSESLTTTNFPDTGVLIIGDNDVTGSGTQIIGYSSKSVASGLITFSLGSNLSADVPSGTRVALFSLEDFLATKSSTSNRMQWLILSEIHVSTSYRPRDLSMIDVRERGGVIREDLYQEAAELDPRSIWLRPQHLLARGQPVPGESVAVFRVPYTVLADYGGTFTRDDVEEIVRKHLAVGVMPVIVYHGAIPEITSGSSGNSVTISWTSEGSNYSYYVYRSSLENGPWTLETPTAIPDQAYGNSYTITGLNPNTVYYFAVSAIDTNGIESPKSLPWGIKNIN